MADYENSTNVRWAQINGQTTILFEIPNSDREISFAVDESSPSLPVMIEMLNGLLNLVDGDDSWEIERDKFTESWYATDQGRWNRYQWTYTPENWSGLWIPVSCQDNLDE